MTDVDALADAAQKVGLDGETDETGDDPGADGSASAQPQGSNPGEQSSSTSKSGESADSSGSSESSGGSLLDRAKNTTPNPSLDSMDDPIPDENPGEYGKKRIQRALWKFAGVDGATAAEDGVLGVVAVLMGLRKRGGGETTEDDEQAAETGQSEPDEGGLY